MIPEAKTYTEVFVCVGPEHWIERDPFIVLGRDSIAELVRRGCAVYQLHNAFKVENVDILINGELKRMVKGTSESNG